MKNKKKLLMFTDKFVNFFSVKKKKKKKTHYVMMLVRTIFSTSGVLPLLSHDSEHIKKSTNHPPTI